MSKKLSALTPREVLKRGEKLPAPDLQLSFVNGLELYKKTYLQGVLRSTVKKLDLNRINAELQKLVKEPLLNKLAQAGLRGELVFPVPYVIENDPKLIAYYRLLLGYSKKEFYSKANFTPFISLEEQGVIPEDKNDLMASLCRVFISKSSYLLEHLPDHHISAASFWDMTLLTLGPQFRGGFNNEIGKAAVASVFQLIHEIVKPNVEKVTRTALHLKNASGREVVISFSSDPDIAIHETISSDTRVNRIAIEIKGGADYSNIWNRLGEAEKSHQTARAKGFVEFWTIYNLDEKVDHVAAKGKSPTTHRFFSLPFLLSNGTDDYREFKIHLLSLVGIKG